MGTVYLARDSFSLREVAVKVSTERSEDEPRLARRRQKLFFTEAKMAGMLRHPNILATLDAGVEGNLRYLVMEYIAGAQTLDRFCHPEDLLPVDQAVGIAPQVRAGARLRPRARHHPPRHQAAQHPAHPGQRGEGRRLRHRADRARRRRRDPGHRTSRLAALHVARAGAGRGGDDAERHLLSRASSPTSCSRASTRSTRARSRSSRAASAASRTCRCTHDSRELPAELSHIIDRTLKKHPAGRYASAVDLAGDLSLVHDELRYASRAEPGNAVFHRLRKMEFFDGFETRRSRRWSRRG